MIATTLILAALALLLSPVLSGPILPATNAVKITAAQLTQISPKSATCPAGGPYMKECATAAKAAAPINHSFVTYNITNPGAAAALIAIMAFESGDFEYAIHHFPGPNPGQGTRNMQSYKYNLQYAQSLPTLAGALPAALVKGPDAVLNLMITYTDVDFGSAAWYMTTQCKGVQDQLATGSMDGWATYMTCIGADDSDARTAYFRKGLAALGVKVSG